MKNLNLSPSELYILNFENPEPKYYSMIPNIIDHLTYQVEEEGKIIHKRLSVYAKELYRVIKMIASENGKDWHSTQSLADIVGCSVGSIINAKKELMSPMDQLDGSPLIKETKRQVTKNDGMVKTIICTRSIVDIWKWNNAFMATLKFRKKGPHSPHESGGGPDSPHESASLGPHSPHESNNNSSNNNPLLKEQQPTDKSVSVCQDVSLHKKDLSEEEVDPKVLQAFNWCLKFGCDVITATKIIKNHSLEELEKATIYLGQQIRRKKQKNETVSNRVGYLLKILENRYWCTN